MPALWEWGLAAGAVAFGTGVSVAVTRAIRRMPSTEPDQAAVDRLIARTPPLPDWAQPIDPLGRVRAVVFDWRRLVDVGDRRNPWREIASRSGRPVDPRSFDGSLMQYAKASAVSWEPGWLDDLEAELESVRVRDGAIKAVEDLSAAGYRIAVTGNVQSPYLQRLRALLDIHWDVEVYSAENGLWRPGRPMLGLLCAELDLLPSEILIVYSGESSVDGVRAFGLQGLIVDPLHPTLPHRVAGLGEILPRLRAARAAAP